MSVLLGRSGKKAEITVSAVVRLAVGLILAFAVVLIAYNFFFGADESLSGVGNSDCSVSAQQKSTLDFKKSIERYSAQEVGGVNFHNSKAAIEDFHLYLACKDNPASSITDAGVNQYDSEIMAAAKTAYVSRATELCDEYAAEPDLTKPAVKKDYEALAVDYSIYFGAGLPPPSGCQIS